MCTIASTIAIARGLSSMLRLKAWSIFNVSKASACICDRCE
jgi:hypothetical protein